MFYCYTVALVALITATIVSSTSFSGRHRKLDGVEDHHTLSYHRTSSLHRRRHAAKLRPIEDLDEMDLFLNLFADGFQAKAGRGARQLINRANKDNEGTKNRVQIDPTVLRVQLQSDANTAGTRDGGRFPMNSRLTHFDSAAATSSAEHNNQNNNWNNANVNSNFQRNPFRSGYDHLTNNASVADMRQRSLSDKPAYEGNPDENAKILTLLTTELLGGFAVKKVKQFNDRTYLSKFRRNYWFGQRYYRLDHDNYFENRDTCIYEMNAYERRGLAYEDGPLIHDIVFQCQRYIEVCCGLTCCEYGASTSILSASRSVSFLQVLSISISLVFAYFRN